jgi:hypothetical protein
MKFSEFLLKHCSGIDILHHAEKGKQYARGNPFLNTNFEDLKEQNRENGDVLSRCSGMREKRGQSAPTLWWSSGIME